MSLSALTWQRFKKERQAIVSLAYIGLIIIVSILGYLITPDSTPFCNHQQLEIALQKPRFTVQLLELKPEQDVPHVNFLHKMLFGQPAEYKTVPIESLQDYGDSVTVRIRNTGEPISQEDLERVFERFYKADKSRSKYSSSAGLGLYLVKRIVTLHNGSVDVKNIDNIYTEFSVTLNKRMTK